MLANIIDNRKRKYRFKKVNVVIEATWHDNSCKDSDHVRKPRNGKDGPDYDQMEHVTIAEGIMRADKYKNPVTLSLYDHDSGIYPVYGPRRKRRKSKRTTTALHEKEGK